jgi:Ala-tRNA(Pro) deacylase
MAIPATVQEYLASKHIQYDLVPHPATSSSVPTAEACHVPADRLAKGVVLRTKDRYVLAVLPASHRISREALRRHLGKDVMLATEDELGRLFRDCAEGAVPAVGECYGIDVVVDDSIGRQPDIYFEAGDHTTVVHVSQAQYSELTRNAPHGHFAVHA